MSSRDIGVNSVGGETVLLKLRLFSISFRTGVLRGFRRSYQKRGHVLGGRQRGIKLRLRSLFPLGIERNDVRARPMFSTTFVVIARGRRSAGDRGP